MKIDEPRRHRRGRGDRARPQRDGRLLAGRGGDRARRSATAGSTPAISGASTRTATCYLVGPIEGRDRRLQRQERLPRRGRGAVPRARPSSRSCRWSACPTASASRWPARWCPTSSTSRRCPRAEVTRARSRSTSARCRPTCRSGSGCKALHFWEGELPKTAKRSIKRREVVAEIAAPAAKHERGQGRAGGGGREGGQVAWLLDTVATVAGRPRADVQLRQPVGRAGLRQPDVHRAGRARWRAPASRCPRASTSRRWATSPSCRSWLRARAGGRGGATSGAAKRRAGRRRTRTIRRPRRRSPRRASAGWPWRSALFYKRVLRHAGEGRQPHPQHTNFIVAANHASHLDMGAIKVALGDAGRGPDVAGGGRLLLPQPLPARLLQATSPTWCRWSARARSASRWTSPSGCCAAGRSMVVFPEGTRSMTGEMADFLPSLGYLALRAEVGILPAHIAGTLRVAAQGGGACRGTRELRGARSGRSCRSMLRGADRRAAAAGGVAAGRGVHPARWSRTCATAWRRRWTSTAARAAWDGEARWARSRCDARPAPRRPRAEVGAMNESEARAANDPRHRAAPGSWARTWCACCAGARTRRACACWSQRAARPGCSEPAASRS